jgi:predicted ferric reductase
MSLQSFVRPGGAVGAAPRSLPLPRSFAFIAARDVTFVIGLLGAIVGAMWVRHGGLGRDPLTAIGQVTALLGTYAALVGVLFMARAPWLDQVFGADRLRSIHRIVGFLSVWALAAHALFSTLAYADGALGAVVPTVVSLVVTVPGMLGAIISMALFALVAVTSIRAARRRLSYESWHGVHLYIYLAVAFGFVHQIAMGQDFVDDPMARAFWIGLYVVAFMPLLLHRAISPIAFTFRHRPRVASIERETDGVFSIYVEGRNFDQIAVRAGQFFVIRALTGRDWTHGHPFSISAAPNGRSLRFTVKELGQGTRALRELRPGTPLLLEGPYGAMHGERRTGRPMVFIAGGIGIAPIRAMAEAFAYGTGEVDLVYRARTPEEAALRRELELLATYRGMRLHMIVGPRGSFGVGADPLGPESLRDVVPDLANRDAFICGPERLIEHARRSLRAIGIADSRIHLELFG